VSSSEVSSLGSEFSQKRVLSEESSLRREFSQKRVLSEESSLGREEESSLKSEGGLRFQCKLQASLRV
jgi:hypothetical protein